MNNLSNKIYLIFILCLVLVELSVSKAAKLRRMPFTFSKHVAALTSLSIFSTTQVLAVSGGGYDYATKDLKGESFVGKVLKEKDFTQCDASGVSFKGAELRGSRFYRAKLFDTDFTGADLSGVSLEDTGLTGAIFTDAVLEGAYLSATIGDAKSILNTDFTDAQLPDFAKKTLCTRPDAGGKNPKTGVSTKDSLFCD